MKRQIHLAILASVICVAIIPHGAYAGIFSRLFQALSSEESSVSEEWSISEQESKAATLLHLLNESSDTQTSKKISPELEEIKPSYRSTASSSSRI